MSENAPEAEVTVATWPTFPPRGVNRERRPLPSIVAQLAELQAGQCLRVVLGDKSAKDVTRYQGRLNSLGRRVDVPFGIETGRKVEDNATVLYIRTTAKRPRKPRTR